MTYVHMQAVATMLNLKIKILTTGIAPDTNLICNRCKPSKGFQTENALRGHTRTEHDRVETEEESEGRVQRARWSEMIPDTRLRDIIPNEKTEELVLLHEDDILYNIIVHKSHNAFKTKNMENSMKTKHQHENSTLFSLGSNFSSPGCCNPAAFFLFLNYLIFHTLQLVHNLLLFL